MKPVCFCQSVLFAILTCISLPGHAQPEKPMTEISASNRAAAHPLVHKGLLTNPQEGLVLGNGDLGVNVQIYSHELKLNLGKNDVWDVRYGSPTTTGDMVITHDELIRHVHENGEVSKDFLFKGGKPGDPDIHYSPLRVGTIRIVHPGWSETSVTSKVEIDRGTMEVKYAFPTGTLKIMAFVHREKNILVLRTSADGKVPWFSIIVERDPGRWNRALPPLEVKHEKGSYKGILTQTVPGRYKVDPLTWHVAASFPDEAQLAAASGAGSVVSEGAVSSRVRREGWSLKQDVVLQDGVSLTFVAAVTTDTDGPKASETRAVEMAGDGGGNRFHEELGTHSTAWADFWAASEIRIEDSELEALWYRGLYSFACHLRPGAQAPGLAANIPISDRSAWHGKYTWNHNVQKWYFPNLPVNHPEWHNVLAELVKEQIPTFQHLAQTVFGLEGVYCDLSGRPRETPSQATTHPVVGRALCHTGWLSAQLFQHFEFTGDPEWLRTQAYPYIREAARFYAAYLDKYQGEDLNIYPSMRLEDLWTERKHNAWGKNFLGNKNVSTDLIYFRKAFEAAIMSSEVLDVDSHDRERWSEHLERVPDIAYGWRNGKGWYAICEDWEKAWPDFDEYLDHVRHSRWGCQAFPVFPGEYIDGDEEEGLAPVIRDIMSEVDLLNLRPRTTTLGAFHGEATVFPFIRMGIMEKFEDIRTLLLGHQYPSGQFSAWESRSGKYVRTPYLETWRLIENQYMQILGITEMLMQSQGGIIRLFPFWPEDKEAVFHDIRARGAFLVSAEHAPEAPLRATIHSLKGNPCHLRWQAAGTPKVSQNGKPVPFVVEGRDLIFDTDPGVIYEIEEVQRKL
ncbi:MAG: hypothetical protein GY790_19065 [Bacteroidetes bacterium]|nr:hypothetical protein [Bacteroidota bacterium]